MIYEMIEKDQVSHTWVMFDELKEEPYVRLKPVFAGGTCPKCRKFSHDEVFKLGFDGGRIRGRGDVIGSADGFLCVNENFVEMVNDNSFTGLQFKPFCTGWFIVNVSNRIDLDPDTYDYRNPRCKACKRHSDVVGNVESVSQLKIDGVSASFFSTKVDRECSSSIDRPVFISEDVIEGMRMAGLKGACFRRLLTPEEYEQEKCAMACGKTLKFKGRYERL